MGNLLFRAGSDRQVKGGRPKVNTTQKCQARLVVTAEWEGTSKSGDLGWAVQSRVLAYFGQ